MKIAYFSPLPPLKTGISVYSAHLIPYIAKISDIEIYHPGPCETISGIKINDFITNPSALKKLEKFDAIVYHLGNNPWYHLDIYRVFLEYPGVVVLHDAVLYYLIAGCGIGGLIKEFCYNYGVEHLSEVWDIVRDSIDNNILRYSNPVQYPLNKRVLENAKQIIIHSRSTAEFIVKSGYFGQLNVVNLIYYPDQLSYSSPEETLKLRNDLGVSEGQILIGTFGFIGPTKRMNKLLEALHKIKKKSPKIQFKLLIVGEGDNLDEVVHNFGLSKDIINLGFVTDKDFSQYLSAVDIILNLRYPSMGEASASLIQAMSFSKPVVVTNHAWFSELPDDAVIKVGFGLTEVDEIVEAITKLVMDKKYRENIGLNAKAYVENYCTPQQVASKYLDIIKKTSKEPLSFNQFKPEFTTWVLEYFQRRIDECVPK